MNGLAVPRYVLIALDNLVGVVIPFLFVLGTKGREQPVTLVMASKTLIIQGRV